MRSCPTIAVNGKVTAAMHYSFLKIDYVYLGMFPPRGGLYPTANCPNNHSGRRNQDFDNIIAASSAYTCAALATSSSTTCSSTQCAASGLPGPKPTVGIHASAMLNTPSVENDHFPMAGARPITDCAA